MIRIGSRGSRLALLQAEIVASSLRQLHPGEVEIVPISTAGDRDRSRPFAEIGDRGIFVKELEQALLNGTIDMAVHSAKDMTASDPDGLVVGAYLERDDPRDALCGVPELLPGMRIGTSSARRRAQLLALEPRLVVEPIRGNVETRLRLRRERGLDAVLLACAGLDRLALSDEADLRFEAADFVPEAGQGALAVQVAGHDSLGASLAARLDHPPTRASVEAERAFVARVGGGCQAPIGAHHDGRVLTAVIAAEDGSWVRRAEGADPAAVADALLAVVPTP